MQGQVFNTDYPYLQRVNLFCRIYKLPTDSLNYYFSYTLLNEASNNGSISSIDIDISRKNNSISYDTVGLKFRSKYLEGEFRRNYRFRRDKIIPASFPILPSMRWTAEIGG
jgi:hypothetical protein